MKENLIQTNKNHIFAALRAAGIASVRTEYNGGGDSGQIDERICCCDSLGNEVACPRTPTLFFGTEYYWNASTGIGEYRQTESELPLPEAILAFFWDVLSEIHGGWETDAGGHGVFGINVSEGTVSLHHEQRYDDYNDSNDVSQTRF